MTYKTYKKSLNIVINLLVNKLKSMKVKTREQGIAMRRLIRGVEGS